jgi:antiviral helicase SKI2
VNKERFKEIFLPELNDSSQQSMSLLRLPGPSKDFVRGSSQQVPFLPGGMDSEHATLLNAIVKPTSDTKKDTTITTHEISVKDELNLLSNGDVSNLLTVPPGFETGVSPSDFQNGSTDVNTTTIVKEQRLEQQIVVGQNSSDLLAPYIRESMNLSEQEIDRYSVEDQRLAYQRKREEDTKRQQRQATNIIRLDDVFGLDEEDEVNISSDQSISQIKQSRTTRTTTTTNILPQKLEKNIISQSRLEKVDTLDELLDITNDQDDFNAKFTAKKSKEKKEWAVLKTTLDDDIINANFHDMVPEMAMEYPFDLDTFQKHAVYHLENNESVFVSAHTSAGKTVVAEYAIALGKKHMTRVIYTSPIKTLSNQKFREFKKTFGDVGILTGDVQINPTATCLIMTTEILRSMLYKGADLIRDVEYVIFDEVHYINDPDRGVVWEEVIIMLPQHINLILLSATIPNYYEFADWVGRTKQKKIYVIQTLKRPVPLQHHLYYNGQLYKIVDKEGVFLSANYRAALQAEKFKKQFSSGKGGGSRVKTDRNDWVKLIDMLGKKTLLPVVVFSFSRRSCEETAYSLSQTDLTASSSEKSEIHIFINHCLQRLNPSDRNLPQVLNIRELLKRGIGVHHSGLLPIVKEMVEILFSRGLIKILFATETFAMGVNMPTKTVVFNQIRKHDGREFRELLSGEYIQMSGRAGRRGLDTVGMVLILCHNRGDESDIPEEPTLQRMILGKATMLESQFRLSYNMILNLLRIEHFRVEDMIKRSFSEAHSQRWMPDKDELIRTQNKLQDLMQSQLEDNDTMEITADNCLYGAPDMDNYYGLSRELEEANIQIQNFVLPQCGPYLTHGRVIVINTEAYGNTLGLLIKQLHVENKIQALVLRLNKENKNTIFPTESGLPFYSPMLFSQAQEESGPLCQIVVVPRDNIRSVTHTKLNVSVTVDEKEETTTMRAAAYQLMSTWEQSGNNIKIVDGVTDLKINAFDFAVPYKRKKTLLQSMLVSPCANCPKIHEQYAKIDRKERIKRGLDMIRNALSDSNLALMPEFDKRILVLQTLRYIDKERTVQLKGRVACEVNSCDELIVTEMIFENFFTALTAEECCSVLSCLLCQDKTEEQPTLTERLITAKENLIQLTMGLGQVQMQCGLEMTPLDYRDTSLNFGMMQVAYEWALGVPFEEIAKLTTIAEGSIVRSINQIDQACREVRNAARVIGDTALYQKMEEASRKIKRDIVFAASLYVV